MYTKMKKKKMKADFPSVVLGGGKFPTVYLSFRMFPTQRKKKRGYVHKNEKEEDEGGFSFGSFGRGEVFRKRNKMRICHFG